jgi:hypothetical protein
VVPQSGKGESYKRAIDKGTGFLVKPLKKFGVCLVDGGTFGSDEFMVKVLKDAPSHRCFFLPKRLIWYLISENRIRSKANLLTQGHELKEQRALASNGYGTRTLGFEPGALGCSCGVNR